MLITLLPLSILALILFVKHLEQPRRPILTFGKPSLTGWLARIRIGRISRFLAPGYGSCNRCHTAWKFVEGHDVFYAIGSGCFPLCQECWKVTTLTEKNNYYLDWLNKYYSSDPNYFTMRQYLLTCIKTEVEGPQPGDKVIFEWFPANTETGSLTPTIGTIIKFDSLQKNLDDQMVPHYLIKTTPERCPILKDIVRVVKGD